MNPRQLIIAAFGLLLPLCVWAQRPVFRVSRPFLDQLTMQYGGDKMDTGEMDEHDNQVLTYMRSVYRSKAAPVEGFARQSDTIRTKRLHLHWEADEDMGDDAYDMTVSGRWIYDVEWPSAEVDPYLILRQWMNKTVQKQLTDTFYGGYELTPYPGGSAELGPMMNYYAGKYRKWYRDYKLAQKENDDNEYKILYDVEFNPTLVIWLRCLSGQYATFYVADFRPAYRSGPDFWQQTINRYNGKEVWLEDFISAETIESIKARIREEKSPFESDGNLDDVIRDHGYKFALTEKGIVLSFLSYTFSITAGSDAFQVMIPYEDIL